jgi:hypothetical protein
MYIPPSDPFDPEDTQGTQSFYTLFDDCLNFFDIHHGRRGLQQATSSAVDDILHAQLLESITDSEARDIAKARLQSAGGRCASAWLAACPEEPLLALSNADYELAMRHRIGLPPSDNMPTRCRCGASLSSPYHFHACVLLRRTAIDKRHSLLMRAQSVNAAQAGILACLEDHNRRNDWPDSEYHLGWEIPIDAEDPDSAFTTHIICDTSVACPCVPSHIANAQHPQRVANYRAELKHSRYRHLAAEDGAANLAFAAESFGTLSKSAHQILSYFRQGFSLLPFPSVSEDRYASLSMQRISVQLQKGNAIVDRMGLRNSKYTARRRTRPTDPLI